ncbi:accessory Sec system glycosyltransferase GtfA [Staphylococcus xylosus]|uniref:accessory Sec system glycosyltransferase GtfA n=1 Tax=Staphylococcus TaxID=1279 RepID=UPI000281FB63|nr:MULTISPECIES: accessory Sec system glycosyltransferase GtfA [Staphylococcus]EJX16624.1 glycosyltransferase [Staphylococcus sp. OJ82]MCA2501305.1 accessory Sec system glycosyltransferase GtfA [Staphylococcus xylosus]MCA2503957.1 accessory Sec system glycosyltransferase GtfA [Staphylococcus xylosus]MCE7781719.1 accessory Sec system glycosyltransferase GtfA [Staphylococcus xylosus]UBV36159.1 accessory Sec system glycosyltransferase GtfA [Staphylococcus xylosus]
MTIYNMNYGIGWASSGVEYAQLYRAQALRGREETLKFVFLEFIKTENIQTLTKNLGFNDDEVIWLYQFFTDIKIAPSSVKLDDIIQSLNDDITKTKDEVKIKKYFFNKNSNYIVCHLKDEDSDIVDRVEYVSRGKLLRKDYYSYVRVFSEYYAPEDNMAKLYMRVFYNEDGSTAYNEYVNGDDSMFVFKDRILYSKQNFIAYFMEKLQLSQKDMILLDRSKDISQVMIENKNQAKLGVVIHAEHYNASTTNDDYILWNNHYEYVFTNAQEIDFFITATEIQNKLLTEQFEKYNHIMPKIYTIPVGNLTTLTQPLNRKPYSIITASRLAAEKRVDWLVKAVAIAKQQRPEITFDIYGEGAQKQTLHNLIRENNAESYITLHGHVNLNQVYKNYELFLSGSTSEGFGLTLMEAIGSGLGLIGFDVNYGNPTFIEDKENGYLIPIKLNVESESEIVGKIAEAIIRFFENDTNDFHEASYKVAEQFTQDAVKIQWNNLIEEVLYD